MQHQSLLLTSGVSLVSWGLWLAHPLARQCSGPVQCCPFHSQRLSELSKQVFSETDQNMLLLEWSHGLSVVRSLLILSSVKFWPDSFCQAARSRAKYRIHFSSGARDMKYISHDVALQSCQQAFMINLKSCLFCFLPARIFKCPDIYLLTLFMNLWYFDKKILCMSNFFVVCNNLSWPSCSG